MKKPSVLMVIEKYPADFGHTTVINNLCKCFNEMGYKSAIGAFSFESDPPNNIEKVKLSKIKLIFQGVNTLNFDIIHSHQPRVNYFLLFRKPTKPVFFHYHGVSNNIHVINFKLSMSLFGKRLTKIISVSKSGLKKIHELIGDISVDVIYNGVDTEFFNPQIVPKYKKGNPQLLFVSGLRKYKNTHLLIPAISKLVKIFPDIYLQIIGSGEEFENLRCLIKQQRLEKNIELTGQILDLNELKFYYASCDLYISASSLEACPVPPFEAMSCGKPLVLSKIEAHDEIIQLSNAGLTFDPTNIDDICNTIKEAIENLTNFGKNGREFVKKNSWKDVCNQIIEMYKETLSEKN